MHKFVNTTARLNAGLITNRSRKRAASNDQDYYPDCQSALAELIDRATNIVILSAYYDINFLQVMFSKKRQLSDKHIVMIFSRPAPSAMPHQISELRAFQQLLRRNGNSRSTIDIRVTQGERFFHSKLYSFSAKKWRRTLIGSSNATRNGFCTNDEILAEIAGPHAGIDHYISSTMRSAENCQEVLPFINERYSSFESMLRDGYMFFKATRTVPKTVDCFYDEPKLSAALENVVKGEPLPGHEGQAIGALNVLTILGIGGQTDQMDAAGRINISSYSIETAYGYWVPSAYKPGLDEKVAGTAESRVKLLLRSGSELESKIRNASEVIDQRYITWIDDRLKREGGQGLRKSQRDRIKERVLKRLNVLNKILSDERECRCLATPLDGVPVPEIWEDPHSRDTMMESFCEHTSWKLRRPTRPGKIVQIFKEWFNLKPTDGPGDVRTKITNFFENGGTRTRGDWKGASVHAKFGADFWLDLKGSGDMDGSEYSNNLKELEDQAKKILKAGRYKRAELWRWESSREEWIYLKDLP